jgi:hypothetical protein
VCARVTKTGPLITRGGRSITLRRLFGALGGRRRQVSKQLADFLELRHEVHTAQAAAHLTNNWFSLHNARRVYTCVGALAHVRQ